MGATEDQSLTVHTMKNFKKKEKKEDFHHNKKKDNKQNTSKRDPSNVRCYTCDENGHFARDYRIKKKRHHAHCCRLSRTSGGFWRGRKLQATGCVLGGKSRVEIFSLNTQLLRLDQLLVKPRGVVPIKKSKVFNLRNKKMELV